MASYIFNLFSEALHWIFEIIFHWNLTHYLDDFLFVYKSQTDLSPIASHYNEILGKIGLITAPEKDMNDTIVTHLGFEFDSLKMEIRLPRHKHSHVLHTVTDLLKAKSIAYSMLDEALGFLSHCCQVILLGHLAISFPCSVAFPSLVHFAPPYLALRRKIFDDGLYFSLPDPQSQ